MRYCVPLLFCILVAAPAKAQSIAKAYYLEYVDDANKTQKMTQVPILKEMPTGIEVEPRRNEKLTIPTGKIVLIRYQPESFKDYLEFSKPFNAADGADKESDPKKKAEALNTAIEGFQKVAEDVKKEKPVYRQVQYRLGKALFDLSKIDETKQDEAITVLSNFHEKLADGWQISRVLEMLAQLQLAKDDLDGQLKTYLALADVEGLSKKRRWEALFSAASVQLRRKNFAGAKDTLSKLDMELPGGSPEKSRIQLLLAQSRVAQGGTDAETALTDIRKILGSTQSSSLKALGHNTIADHYLKAKKNDLAFWEFFRVHVMYSEDPKQHAKALYHLSELFMNVKQDKARADECAELLKNKEYEGTIYQKMLLQKK